MGWMAKIPRCWKCDPARVNAALVGPQRGGQKKSNESLGAAGNKRPRTALGLPKKDVCPAVDGGDDDDDDDEAITALSY
ncbi:jg15530 [Pararge aegeria aegeria]|uniref:Jg15530 protein n=1 Tax=Pararge aegeria aegeria TaxID=348720 RepID=A0A8S4SFD9_9NEOP|nr:jg15530 [Pararge aegeria aegeria]